MRGESEGPPFLKDGRGCEEDMGKLCLRLAELLGLLINMRVSIASCSRTFCSEMWAPNRELRGAWAGLGWPGVCGPAWCDVDI